MKNVLLVFALALFSLSASAEANYPGPSKKAELNKALLEMIGNPRIADRNFQEETLTVKFTVNETGEIVVLHTDSDRFDSYIKRQLNYQKLSLDLTKPGKTYVLPVTIVKS